MSRTNKRLRLDKVANEYYKILPGESLAVFEDERAMPDNYYVGKNPPSERDIEGDVDPVYWFSCDMGSVFKYDRELHEQGIPYKSCWVPTEEVGKYVVDIDSDRKLIGKIVYSGSEPLAMPVSTKPVMSFRELAERAQEKGSDITKIFEE